MTLTKDINILAIEAKSGSLDAKKELSERMYSYALNIARTFSRKISGGDAYIEDYRNEAMIGMLEALSSYDASKGSFYSYSIYAMRQRVRDFISFHQRVISQPKNVTEKIAKLSKAIAAIKALGEEPTEDELMARTGYSKRVLEGALMAMNREYIYSLDSVYGEGENEGSLLKSLPSEVDVEEELLENEERGKMLFAISKLNNKEKFLLCSLFGAFGYKKQSAKELSESFGLSISSIHNYRKSISERLRVEVLGA